jgi:hypothetical protein
MADGNFVVPQGLLMQCLHKFSWFTASIGIDKVPTHNLYPHFSTDFKNIVIYAHTKYQPTNLGLKLGAQYT